jgi:hypothetical protein
MADTEDQQIREGSRLMEFLSDPVVAGAILRLDQKYFEEWKAGDTVEKRESAHAKTRVLDDLKIELQAVVDSGVRANAEKTRRERGKR